MLAVTESRLLMATIYLRSENFQLPVRLSSQAVPQVFGLRQLIGCI
jgi:hypothetical protein